MTTLGDNSSIRYSIARTSDQGKSWQVTPAGLFEPNDPEALSNAVFLQFLDPENGYMVVRRATSSNFRVGALFRTSDGGASWQRLWIPIGDPVGFVTTNKGWVAGGATGDELYQTTDGGNSWQRQEVGGGKGQNRYRLPVFSNENSGTLPVVVKQGTTAQVQTYVTEDGGSTWQLSASVPIDREVYSGHEVPLSVEKDQHWTVIVPHAKRTLRSAPKGQIDSLTNTGPDTDSIDSLEMVTDQVGWASSSKGNCSGTGTFDLENPDPNGVTCTSQVNLLRTEDGGVTWQNLALPGAQALLGSGYKSEIYAGQGFDSCSIPSTALMQDWAANSPYRVWNLYIGGSSLAACGTLSSSYIQQLASIGWRFIPTWVGPQAACTSFSTRMSYDTGTAYSQGRAEADKAIERSAALGLTNADKTGAIIYYDLEFFNTSDAACKAAATSFMNGWAQRLHERGNQAGVYGSPCSSAVPDFANNANKLDAVWLAVWITPNQYRANVSLSSVVCISSTLWPTHQRMRQYSGGHYESWGSSSISSIDTNVIDAPVVELGRNSDCPQSGGATLYWNTGYSCANSSSDAGYRQQRAAGLLNVNNGSFNDKASSLRVPAGWSVMLYENADRGGGKTCINTDMSDLSAQGNFEGSTAPINDNVTSMEVFENSSCDSTPPPQPAYGYWNVTYYLGTQFGTQCKVATEPGPFLFKDWGAGLPNSACRADNWSARYTNTVHFLTGAYTFSLGSDDYARIKIGTETVVDTWNSSNPHYVTRQMTEGDYAVTVEYAETTGDARVAAWWVGPGFEAPRQVRDPKQWYAQYWGNTVQWWDPIVQVNEGSGALDHQWGLNGPGYGLPSDQFSARFQRQVNFNCGTYVFHVKADDGVRFAVDGKNVLDKWTAQSATFDVPVALSTGAHDLTVDYYDGTQAALVGLSWDQQSSCLSPSPTKAATSTRTSTSTPTRVPTSTPTRTPTATNPPAATATRTATKPPATTTSAPTRTSTSMPTATPGSAQWQTVFSDSFESGNFSAWTSSVTDGGNLSVSTTGAMDGSRAMNARINDNNVLSVTKNLSTAGTSYKGFFRFDPNSISMVSGNTFWIFAGGDASGVDKISVRLRRYAGAYQLQSQAKDNAGVMQSSGWYNISDIPHRVELTWQAADAGKSNGYLLLSLDNAVNIANLTGFNNSQVRVNMVKLGAVNGIDSGTRGTIIFDNFIASQLTGTVAPPATNTPIAAPTRTATATNTSVASPTRTATKPAATATRTATKPPATTTSAPTRTSTSMPTATPGSAQWQTVFSDSFESGNFSAWTSSVTDGGNLSVSTTGAMDGSRAMNARINDNNVLSVTKNLSTAGTSYKGFFRFDPNSISMVSGNTFWIFAGGDASGVDKISVRLRRYAGAYQLQSQAKDNAGVMQSSGWYNISDIPHRVELTWQAADAGKSNGYLLLSLDNAVNIANLTGFNNSQVRVNMVKLGAVNGIDSGTRGTIIFDNFIASQLAGVSEPAATNTPVASPSRTPAATNTPAAAPTRTPTKPAVTATAGTLKTIFSDNFEAGNLNAWDSAMTDSGDLNVSTAAALSGSRGMRALIDDNNAIYVISDKPAQVRDFSVSFRFDPNSTSMTDGDKFTIFNGSSAGGTEVLRLLLSRSSGAYRLNAGLKDSSTWIFSDWYLISDIPHRIQIDWKAAGTGQTNGSMKLWIDGALLGDLSGVSNSSYDISRVRLGAVGGVDSGTRGKIYFDDFIVRGS